MTRTIGLKEGGWVPISIPELPWRVEIQVESVDGTPQILGLKLEPDVDEQGRLPPPFLVRDVVINSSKLRTLPLARLRNAAFALRRMDLDKVVAALQPAVRKPGQPLPPGHLEGVADVYRMAVEASEPPLPAIMRRWRVTRPTASRWVRSARDSGILGWPSGIGVPGCSSPRSPTITEDREVED